MNIINLKTGEPFDPKPRLHHRDEIPLVGAAGAVSPRAMSFITARNLTLGGARKLTARDYVQNGLIAMWDGIENAGWGVHDAATTAWKDLVGTNDMAKSGLPEFDDTSSTVNGANYWTVNDGNSVLNFHPFSVEAVFSPLENRSNTQPLGNNGNGGFTVINRGGALWGAAVNWTTGAYSYKLLNFGDIAVGEIANISYVGESGSQKAFKNSIICESSSYGGSFFSFAKQFGIGRSGSASGCRSRFFCVRIYNRALTSAEIAHNYAVDKVRFSLA